MNAAHIATSINTLTTVGKMVAVRLWYSIDRPTTISIRCPQCGTWIPPRQYNPRTNRCRRCCRPAVAYAQFRAARAAMA